MVEHATLVARIRSRLDRRASALVLTLLAETVLVLAVLSLGLVPDQPKTKPGTRLVSIAVRPANDDKPQTEPARPAKSAAVAAVQPQSTARPDQPAPQPVQPVPASSPPAIIPVARDQMAAFDISRLPRQAAPAGPSKGLMGPVDTGVPGDSKRVGSAPNGQPMYAAAWYREPYPGELDGYLSTAHGPGYALIACRTIANWKVDDCVALDEYPAGNELARAVLAAAWQFQVRPPRIGGVYKVGEWVRIRIDYSVRPARGG